LSAAPAVEPVVSPSLATGPDAEVAALAAHVGLGPAIDVQPPQAPAPPEAAAPGQEGSVLPFTVPTIEPKQRPWYQLEEQQRVPEHVASQLSELRGAIQALHQASQPEPQQLEYDIDPQVGLRLDAMEQRLGQMVQPLIEEQRWRVEQEQMQAQQAQEIAAARSDIEAFVHAGQEYAKTVPEYPAIRAAAIQATVESWMMVGHSEQEAKQFAASALRNVYQVARSKGVDPALFHHRLIAAQAQALHGAVASRPAQPAAPPAPSQSLPHPAAVMPPGGGSSTPTLESAVRAAAASGNDADIERIVMDPRWGGTLDDRLSRVTSITTAIARETYRR
jgi:AcrR family transcriptional regulator